MGFIGENLRRAHPEVRKFPIPKRMVAGGIAVVGAVGAISAAAGWIDTSSNQNVYEFPLTPLSGIAFGSFDLDGQNGASDNSRQFSIIPPEQAFHLPTDPVQLCPPVDEDREFPISPTPQWREVSLEEVEREATLEEEAKESGTIYFHDHSYAPYQTPDGKTHYYEVRLGEDDPNDDFVEMIQVPIGTPVGTKNPDGTATSSVPWEMTTDQVPGDPTVRIVDGDVYCRYPTVNREFVGFAPPTNIPNPVAPRNITSEGTITGSSEFKDPTVPTIPVQPESIRIS